VVAATTAGRVETVEVRAGEAGGACDHVATHHSSRAGADDRPAVALCTDTVRTAAVGRRPAAARASAALPYEPARPILEAPPTRVPAPFPLPRGARARVRVEIDRRGHVVNARILESGAGYLDAPLLRAARSWRYAPARRAGQPASSVRVVDVQLR
jgi:TonB family protein